MALPNVIIAGVNKAGTTSLFRYLSRHPQVSTSSIKETCYFLPIRYGKLPDDLSVYESYFDEYRGNQKIRMESTPGYFYGKEIPRAISETLGNDIRIIIVLRNPSSRAISFYNFMISMLKIDKDVSMEQYIKSCLNMSNQDLQREECNPYFALEGGNYAKYLDEWICIFGNRLKIIFQEDMNSNLEVVMSDICRWLNIDESFYIGYDFERENASFFFKNRWLHKAAIKVNIIFEPFFNRTPFLKKIIKKVYVAFNKSENKFDFSKEVNFLDDYYYKNNIELKAVLKKHGINKFPNWIE